MKVEEILRYYDEGMITDSELLSHLVHQPESEVRARLPERFLKGYEDLIVARDAGKLSFIGIPSKPIITK